MKEFMALFLDYYDKKIIKMIVEKFIHICGSIKKVF